MSRSRLSVLTLGAGLLIVPAISKGQPAQKNEPVAPAQSPNNKAATSTETGWTSTADVNASAAVEAPVPAPTSAPASASATAAPATELAAPVNTAVSRSPTTEPAAASSDEPPTLFGGQHTRIGGYGALAVHYARINGQDGVLSGIEGALLLDHRLAIGFAGYGWGNQGRLPASQDPYRDYLHFAYGGLLVRYHVYIPNSPVYFSAGAVVGGGVVGLTGTWDGDLHRDNTDGFFIFEPMLGVHVNFTRWMRMGVDAGYRLTSGVGKFGFTESDFNGISLGGNIGFGWF